MGKFLLVPKNGMPSRLVMPNKGNNGNEIEDGKPTQNCINRSLQEKGELQ
jgi:hypothetical protein